MLRRSQALGAAGNFDGVGIRHADALEELATPQVESVIEAPKDGRVAMIVLARSLEVKHLFHNGLLI